MLKTRLLFFISGFILAAVLGALIIQYAKGFRFDIENLKFQPTGILVATSNPDGAQVFVNGKLTTATNQTIDLPPDTYDVQVTKEGYVPWTKRLTIQKEVVTKIDALLFPKAPSLSPLTFEGASRPFTSPDGTKLAWIVPASRQGGPSTPTANSKAGLWMLELANLPFGFARNARQVTDADLSNATLVWSPDGRSILAEKPNGTFLIEAGKMTAQQELVALPISKVAQLKAEWQKEEAKELKNKLEKLPDEVRDILERKTSSFAFSPDQTKVLFAASSSAKISDNLIPPLPGSSTQRQERAIKQDKTYIYDIKEDRNFSILQNSEGLTIGNLTLEIENSTRRVVWFPTSRHIVTSVADNVSILEYDGTNKVPMWQAAYIPPYAFPTPDGSQLIILTTLGATNSQPNLYTINLK